MDGETEGGCKKKIPRRGKEDFTTGFKPAARPGVKAIHSLRHWFNDRQAGSAFVQRQPQFHKRQHRASNLGGQVTDEMTEMTGVNRHREPSKSRGWPVSAKQVLNESAKEEEGPHSERVTRNREQGKWTKGRVEWKCQPFNSLFSLSPTPHCCVCLFAQRHEPVFFVFRGTAWLPTIRDALSVEQTTCRSLWN